jgi:hypothetical protein
MPKPKPDAPSVDNRNRKENSPGDKKAPIVFVEANVKVGEPSADSEDAEHAIKEASATGREFLADAHSIFL